MHTTIRAGAWYDEGEGVQCGDSAPSVASSRGAVTPDPRITSGNVPRKDTHTALTLTPRTGYPLFTPTELPPCTTPSCSCRWLLLRFTAGADKLVLVAGGGTGADNTEATKAELIKPFGVDFEGERIVIVEMEKGERLRSIDGKGRLVTLAGKEGVKGDEGDNRPADAATFNGMHSLAVGPGTMVFLADTWNNRVRKYDFITKSVTPFAGTGVKGFSGDGGPSRGTRSSVGASVYRSTRRRRTCTSPTSITAASARWT